MNIKISICLFLSVVTFNISAQRRITDLTQDWKFHLGHSYNVEKDFHYGDGSRLQFAKLEPAPYGGHSIDATILKFDDEDWQTINIPHDWSPNLPYDANQDPKMGNRYGFKPVDRLYPATSIGWYRKSFNVNKDDESKITTLEFDGVFRDCKVWVNGFYMGSHWSGYTGFDFDISDYLKYGGDNIIVVRVDASLHEGWFYEGSGINKEVRLVTTNPFHIENIGSYITTSQISGKATIQVKTKILNEDFTNLSGKISTQIVDKSGKVIAESTTETAMVKKRSHHIFQQTLDVKNPYLWSVNEPYQYTLLQKVIIEEKIVDNYKSKFGIRSLKFDANKGLLVNNKRVQINGVCIHQNFAGVGSGIPEALHYYRLKLLKEMGVNAVRSHYPFSQSMLHACDSLGMMVMDEVRSSGSTKESLGQIEWMVNNHRNHPSIIIWSMANEEGGTQRNSIGKRYMKKMVDLTHRLDPSRQVTAGVNAWGSKVDFGFSQEIDVMGFNYSLDFIDEYHKNHPNQPLIGTETTNASVTRDVYIREGKGDETLKDGVGGYYSPEGALLQLQKIPGHVAANAINKYNHVFKTMKFYKEREFLAGSFFWTGFDYNGETWGGKFPTNSSQFGAIDIAGFPKDVYYYYQSWWTKKNVLHIAQHWNWEGNEGKNVDVLVFSNADKVVLFLNGKELETKEVPKYGFLQWSVKYTPGNLKVVGYTKGEKVSEEIIKTAGKPSKLKLISDKMILKATGKDVVIVKVEVVDKKGNLVPLANNLIQFEIEGDAKILGVGNGNPATAEIDTATQRMAFNGKAMVIIQAGKTIGKIKLIAKSEGMNDVPLSLNLIQ